MSQIQKPTTNYSPMAHTGEPRQQNLPGQRLLRPVGNVFLVLGLAIFALLVVFGLNTGSVGSIELIIVLFTSSTLISLGLLLRYWSRAGGEQNLIASSAADTTRLSEGHVSKSLSPGASSITPVSSVTEGTTELLDAKKEFLKE